MPELPEVENVRRTLEPRVVGRRVGRVQIARRDVVRGRCTAAALGQGMKLQRIERHGKQLALVFNGACVCVHLGMSGSLRCDGGTKRDHVHVKWRFEGGEQVQFRDPRRFGGLWTTADMAQLHQQRWRLLGDDALAITPGKLHGRLAGTRRAVKAVLLDQHVLAGLGNIYVDEMLFTARVHPMTRGCDLDTAAVRRLVGVMRRLLQKAIEAGGSSLRDYVDGDGQQGRFQVDHRVYGRDGETCTRCKQTLAKLIVAGRTTVFCERCQRLNRGA